MTRNPNAAELDTVKPLLADITVADAEVVARFVARFQILLHEPGAEVAGIGRLVRQAWLAGLTVDEARRYWFDTAYHAEAFHAGYIVAALLLRAAGANAKGQP